jgi:hypothetical protein
MIDHIILNNIPEALISIFILFFLGEKIRGNNRGKPFLRMAAQFIKHDKNMPGLSSHLSPARTGGHPEKKERLTAILDKIESEKLDEFIPLPRPWPRLHHG